MLYMMLNKEEEIKKDLKSMMLGLENLEMEEIIDNLFKEFFFDSYVCGFHLHEDIWNSRIVEDCLKRPHGKGNEHGDFAIGVYRNNEIKEKIVEHFTCLKQYLNLSNFCDQNFILRSRKSM